MFAVFRRPNDAVTIMLMINRHILYLLGVSYIPN